MIKQRVILLRKLTSKSGKGIIHEFEKCFDYCGDKNAFIPLLGFALSDISETLDEEEKEIITLVFTNDHHVAIDISVQDGRVTISEPYAVKEDLTAITDEEAAV